jgi:hypothetical protein
MGRAADPDACVGDHINIRLFAPREAISRIAAQIDLVIPIRYVERLRQFTRSGTEIAHILCSASLLHQRNSQARLDRADQDQSVAGSGFYQHVQHPMHSVVKINVGRARFVAFHKLARTRSAKCVRCLVVLGQIRFALDDNSFAPSPYEGRANQIRRTDQRIPLEKFSSDQLPRLTNRRLIVNWQTNTAFNRLTVPERRHKFCIREIGQRGFAEPLASGILIGHFDILDVSLVIDLKI